MKKLFYIPAVLAFAVFAACGPSAAEKETKRLADSTKVADSLAVIQAAEAAKAQASADSLAAVAAASKAQATADSLAAVAAAPKGKGKK